MLRFRLRMEFACEASGEAVQVLRSLVGPIRAEAGCTATRLLRDADRDVAVTFEAEWHDEIDLRRHLCGESFRRILATIELASRAPEVEIDVVASRRGFDLVEEVLGPGPEDRRVPGVPDTAP